MSQVRHIPKQGFGIKYLVPVLEFMTVERRANDVYRHSPYRFKKGTQNVLEWCVVKGLVTRREDYRKSLWNSAAKSRPNVYYRLTEKGFTLLELLR